jgi:large subunit ribosomal protein MRP49
MELRKFWHDYLPRLKYHNPTVAMSVRRVQNPGPRASIEFRFGDATFDAEAPESAKKLTEPSQPQGSAKEPTESLQPQDSSETPLPPTQMVDASTQEAVEADAPQLDATAPPITSEHPSPSNLAELSELSEDVPLSEAEEKELKEREENEKLERKLKDSQAGPKDPNLPLLKPHSSAALPESLIPGLNPLTTPLESRTGLPRPLPSQLSVTSPTIHVLRVDRPTLTAVEILAQVLAITGAKQVVPTEAEREELEEMRKEEERADGDRRHVAGLLAEKRHEEESLKIARGEINQAMKMVNSR